MEQNANSALQENMQKFGRFLSGMVMPNIGAFIAWGLLTALFIPTGWLPNEYLANVGGPMSKWLIPLLIGYTGGSTIYGHRGGVLGAIVLLLLEESLVGVTEHWHIVLGLLLLGIVLFAPRGVAALFGRRDD